MSLFKHRFSARLRASMAGLMGRTALAILVAGAVVSPGFAEEKDESVKAYPAVLAGHAVLPAATTVTPPADAPRSLQVSGKFTSKDGSRLLELGAEPGTTWLSHPEARRETGFALPMYGQPVQGFSGIRSLGENVFVVLTDNGFGTKRNSADAMLMIHFVQPVWAHGHVHMLGTVFLKDPFHRVPFPIVNEGTDSRYLTGADFDIESIQPVEGGYMLADEFGPYLLRIDANGVVTEFHETEVDGTLYKSPDHYSLSLPSRPDGAVPAFNTRRSRGFEGMARSRHGSFVYPMLEGPVWLEEEKAFEAKDGKPLLRLFEFDVSQGTFTDKVLKYPLEAEGHAIGDFNMIDGDMALVIERDSGEGDPAQACSDQEPPSKDCFTKPARFKRIYKVDLGDTDADGVVRKIGYIDLMAIQDPEERAVQGGKDGVFTFPFVTIEDVDVVDDKHIIVGNDNNFPFSAGRALDRNDDNELILLEVEALLRAK